MKNLELEKKIEEGYIEPQNIIDLSLEELEYNRYVSIKGYPLPHKNDLCAYKKCKRQGWAATIIDKPPKDGSKFNSMQKDGKTIYTITCYFAWHNYYVYHKECLIKKLGQKKFNKLVKLGDLHRKTKTVQPSDVLTE